VSTTIQAAPVLQARASTSRVTSVDLVRGLVMVIMAIDHVRVYSGLAAGGAAPGIFLTRWITHFCAPAFIFLAGTSIAFYARKHTDVSRYLLVRGAWLIILEVTILRLSWTFNLDFAHYEMAGVLWVIGWSMILMTVLVKLPVTVNAAVGLLIIAGHNTMDSQLPKLLSGLDASKLSGLWKILYIGFYAGPVQFAPDGPNLIVLYSLIPWIGVMAAGYAFATILKMQPQRRTQYCFAIGLSAIFLFLILRGFNLYGDPRPWHSSPLQARDGRPQMPAVLSFLNCTKYPASLNFLLMTLGPIIAVLPLLDSARGFLSRVLVMFGRVPFFFYVLHIPLVHTLALIVSKVRLGYVSPWLFMNHPMGNPEPPEGYIWSLPLLYLVWAIAVFMLYFPCRWFSELKSTRKDWYLKYF
jgi:uncharacterized membrane protein